MWKSILEVSSALGGLSVAIAVLHWIWSQLTGFRRRLAQSEQEFEEILAKEATLANLAGSTIPKRSDVGYWMLFRVAAIECEVQNFRHMSLTMLFLYGIGTLYSPGAVSPILICVLSLICMLAFLLTFFVQKRIELQRMQYINRFSAFYFDAITKHADDAIRRLEKRANAAG